MWAVTSAVVRRFLAHSTGKVQQETGLHQTPWCFYGSGTFQRCSQNQSFKKNTLLPKPELTTGKQSRLQFLALFFATSFALLNLHRFKTQHLPVKAWENPLCVKQEYSRSSRATPPTLSSEHSALQIVTWKTTLDSLVVIYQICKCQIEVRKCWAWNISQVDT